MPLSQSADADWRLVTTDVLQASDTKAVRAPGPSPSPPNFAGSNRPATGSTCHEALQIRDRGQGRRACARCGTASTILISAPRPGAALRVAEAELTSARWSCWAWSPMIGSGTLRVFSPCSGTLLSVRRMSRTRTWLAVLVIAVAVTAGCDGFGSAATHPRQANNSSAGTSPSPLTAVPSSPEPIPPPRTRPPVASSSAAPAAGPQRCHTSQLAVRFVGENGAAGHTYATFDMTNKSTATCWLYGFVGMQMLDSDGHALPTRVLRNGGIFTGRAGPTRFDLPQSRSASFEVAWSNVPGGPSCPLASQLVVTPPDEFDHVTLQVSEFVSFWLAPCDTGELDVQPMRPPSASAV